MVNLSSPQKKKRLMSPIGANGCSRLDRSKLSPCWTGMKNWREPRCGRFCRPGFWGRHRDPFASVGRTFGPADVSSRGSKPPWRRPERHTSGARLPNGRQGATRCPTPCRGESPGSAAGLKRGTKERRGDVSCPSPPLNARSRGLSVPGGKRGRSGPGDVSTSWGSGARLCGLALREGQCSGWGLGKVEGQKGINK